MNKDTIIEIIGVNKKFEDNEAKFQNILMQ